MHFTHWEIKTTLRRVYLPGIFFFFFSFLDREKISGLSTHARNLIWLASILVLTFLAILSDFLWLWLFETMLNRGNHNSIAQLIRTENGTLLYINSRCKSGPNFIHHLQTLAQLSDGEELELLSNCPSCGRDSERKEKCCVEKNHFCQVLWGWGRLGLGCLPAYRKSSCWKVLSAFGGDSSGVGISMELQLPGHLRVLTAKTRV